MSDDETPNAKAGNPYQSSSPLAEKRLPRQRTTRYWLVAMGCFVGSLLTGALGAGLMLRYQFPSSRQAVVYETELLGIAMDPRVGIAVLFGIAVGLFVMALGFLLLALRNHRRSTFADKVR